MAQCKLYQSDYIVSPFEKKYIYCAQSCNYCHNMFNWEGINVFDIMRMKKKSDLQKNRYNVCPVVNCFNKNTFSSKEYAYLICISRCHFSGIYSLYTPSKSQAFNDSN